MARRLDQPEWRVGDRPSGRFEIRRKLGAGGRGLVYEAWDHELQASVALKTLQSLDPAGLYRFKNEFRAAQDLRHDNIVQLGELVSDGDITFFTMELLEGSHFLDYVQARPNTPTYSTAFAIHSTLAGGHTTLEGLANDSALAHAHTSASQLTALGALQRLDQHRLRAALAQLAAALNALHRLGRVHRDVKSSNIIVTERGRLVLVDFGIVQTFTDQLLDDSFVGTLPYMAPEQAGQDEVTPAADIFAVGVLLYRAMTGRFPYLGSPIKVALAKRMSAPPRIPLLDREGPRDLVDLCWRMLAPDPAARPTTEDLLGATKGAPLTPNAASFVASPTRNSDDTATIFVGRQHELARLDRLATPWRDGGGAAIIVRGPPGIGKTALVDFWRRGREIDDAATVLSGRCFERESMPFKAFDAVLNNLTRALRERPNLADSLIDELRSLARIFPVLGILPQVTRGSLPQATTSRKAREQAFRALVTILTRLAQERPLLLLIDDLQWADADSLQLLEFVWARIRSAPCLLLMTARLQTSSVRGGRLTLRSIDAEADLAGLDQLELSGLTERDAAKLINQLARAEHTDAAQAPDDRVINQTGGHPLFLRELVWYTQRQASPASQPLDLIEVLTRRIEELDGTSRAIVDMLATAGLPLPRSVLATAVGMTQAECFLSVETLRINRVVKRRQTRDSEERVELFHDRLREAGEALNQGERTELLHRRLADALASSEFGRERPQLLVGHLRRAGRIQEAAQQAIKASEKAIDALAFARAAELLTTAMELTDDPSRVIELEKKRADCLQNAGHSLRAARALRDLASRFDEPLSAAYLQRAAGQAISGGDLAMGQELLQRVLEDHQISLPQSRLGTLLRIGLNRLAYTLQRRLRRDSMPAHTQLDARVADRLETMGIVARRMALIDSLSAFEMQTRELYEAFKAGDRLRYAICLASDAGFRGAFGNHRDDGHARAQLKRARELATAADDESVHADLLVLEGVAAHTFGDFRRALNLTERAEAALRRSAPGQQYKVNSARLFQCYALREIGLFGTLKERVHSFREDANLRGDQFMFTTMGRGFSIVWLAQDDQAAAHESIEDATWTPLGDEFHLQHWYELRARAELALYAGHIRAGFDASHDWRAWFEKTLRSDLARAIQATRAEALWLWARLALMKGDLKAARRAADRLESESGRAYLDAWKRALKAARSLALGRLGRAVDELRRAALAAQDSGLDLLAALCRLQRDQVALDDDQHDRRSVADLGVKSPDAFTKLYFPRTP